MIRKSAASTLDPVIKRAPPSIVTNKLLDPKTVLQMVADKKLREVKDPARVMRFVASTEHVDRMGDIVRQNWDLGNYKRNPVVLWDHDYKTVLGRSVGEEVVDIEGGKALTMYVEFWDAPHADEVFKGFVDGFLKGGSVGFTPVEVDDVLDEQQRAALGLGGTGVVYNKAELSEFSLCAVPANPNALVTTIKSIPLERLQSLSKAGVKLVSKSTGEAYDDAAYEAVVKAISSVPDGRGRAASPFISELLEGKIDVPEFERRVKGLAKTPSVKALVAAAKGLDFAAISRAQLPEAVRRDLEILSVTIDDFGAEKVKPKKAMVADLLAFVGLLNGPLTKALSSCKSRDVALAVLKPIERIARAAKELESELEDAGEDEVIEAPSKNADSKLKDYVTSLHEALDSIDPDDPSTFGKSHGRAMLLLGRIAEMLGLDFEADAERRAPSEPSIDAPRPPREPGSTSPRPEIGDVGGPGFRSSSRNKLREAKRALRKASAAPADPTLKSLFGLSKQIEQLSG